MSLGFVKFVRGAGRSTSLATGAAVLVVVVLDLAKSRKPRRCLRVTRNKCTYVADASSAAGHLVDVIVEILNTVVLLVGGPRVIL